MTNKVAIFVPPYKLSTRESDKSTVRDASLLRHLIQKAEQKGYRIIEMNHPRDMWSVTDLERRRRNLLERLKKLRLEGKEVIFIGHSLGAFLLKANLRELPKLVRKPFKVITIGGIHAGQAWVPKGEPLLRKLSKGWERQGTKFRQLTENPRVPKGCKLVEFYSPKDPILYPSPPKYANPRNITRIPMRLTEKETGLEMIGRISKAFIVHHLFHGHETPAVRKITRHFR